MGKIFLEANRNKSVTRLKIVNRSCHPAAQAYIEGSCAEFFIIKHRGITGDKWAEMSKMPKTANLKFHAKVLWIPGSRGVVSLKFKWNPRYCWNRCLARGMFINWDLSGFLSDWKQKEVLHWMVFPACAYCILLFPVLKLPAVMLNHGGQGETESCPGSDTRIWGAVEMCPPIIRCLCLNHLPSWVTCFQICTECREASASCCSGGDIGRIGLT